MTRLNRAMVSMLLGGTVVFGLVGWSKLNHSYLSTIPKAPETHKESINTALKQVNFHVEVPTYFPFSVTSSYAIVSPEPAHPKVVRVILYYINTDTNQVITEDVVNILSATAEGNSTKKLTNGLKITILDPFDWHWTAQGVTYDLKATKKLSSGNMTNPNFAASEMEQIVASMG